MSADSRRVPRLVHLSIALAVGVAVPVAVLRTTAPEPVDPAPDRATPVDSASRASSILQTITGIHTIPGPDAGTGVHVTAIADVVSLDRSALAAARLGSTAGQRAGGMSGAGTRSGSTAGTAGTAAGAQHSRTTAADARPRTQQPPEQQRPEQQDSDHHNGGSVGTPDHSDSSSSTTDRDTPRHRAVQSAPKDRQAAASTPRVSDLIATVTGAVTSGKHALHEVVQHVSTTERGPSHDAH